MPWNYARKGGREFFDKIGNRTVQQFVGFCGLRPNERVLDVGSGVGRIAIALTRYLDAEGRYEGFDVAADGILWCQQNVTPRFPNFRFQVADTFNTHYNPTGSTPASEYRFPYADASFDLVFLSSVFTHMLPADVENYLGQIARVLRPGGRCYVTILLLNETSLEDIKEGRSTRDFRFDKGVYRVNKDWCEERALAYDEDYVRRVFPENGLTIDQVHYEGWSRRAVTGEGHQDIIIATKPA